MSWLFVFGGEWLAYFLIVAFIIYIFSLKRFTRRFYYLAVALLSVILSRGIITEIMRLIIISPRPFVALGVSPLIDSVITYSMPSGHMTSLVPLGLTVYEINRPFGRWFIGLTVIMGISRILLGVHWPSDIIVGFLIGILSFYLVKAILPGIKVDTSFN